MFPDSNRVIFYILQFVTFASCCTRISDFHFESSNHIKTIDTGLQISQSRKILRKFSRPCSEPLSFGEISNQEYISEILYIIISFFETLSKLYDVPVGFVAPPPHLRQCIAIYAVVGGWLLLDIG